MNEIKSVKDKCKYIVIGKETAPTTGTPHLHVFIIYPKNVRTATARAMWPTRIADFTYARKDSVTCRNYCIKGGDFWEHGETPVDKGEGEKERWEQAREAAKNGDWEAIPADIFIRYIGNLKKIYTEAQPIPEPVQQLDFHWFYGPTGTGKSLTARRENPDYYLKGINRWWDGYTGQECVIIEEWSPLEPGLEKLMGHYLKQWADHHPFQAETKGGMKMIRPPKIIVTSNYSLEDCFHDPNLLDPLKRRFKIHHFNQWPPRNNSPINAETYYTQTPPNQWQLFPPCSPTQQQP